MIRAIAFLGLLLASAGLWLAPETVSIMGENIEPVRYERPAAAAQVSTAPLCMTSVPIANGSSSMPVVSVCSVGTGGSWSSTSATSITAVTGR